MCICIVWLLLFHPGFGGWRVCEASWGHPGGSETTETIDTVKAVVGKGPLRSAKPPPRT